MIGSGQRKAGRSDELLSLAHKIYPDSLLCTCFFPTCWAGCKDIMEHSEAPGDDLRGPRRCWTLDIEKPEPLNGCVEQTLPNQNQTQVKEPTLIRASWLAFLNPLKLLFFLYLTHLPIDIVCLALEGV